MKVKLLTGRAGTTTDGRGFSQTAGEIIDVGKEEGARMIAANLAEEVTGNTPETATKPKASRSVRKAD